MVSNQLATYTSTLGRFVIDGARYDCTKLLLYKLYKLYIGLFINIMVSKAGHMAGLRSLRRAVDVSVDLCWAEGVCP